MSAAVAGKRAKIGPLRPSDELKLKFTPLRGESTTCSMCHARRFSVGAVVRDTANPEWFHVICMACCACLADACHDSNRAAS